MVTAEGMAKLDVETVLDFFKGLQPKVATQIASLKYFFFTQNVSYLQNFLKSNTNTFNLFFHLPARKICSAVSLNSGKVGDATWLSLIN